MENASGINMSSGCCPLQIPNEDGSGVFLLSAGVVDGGILVPVQIFLRVFFRQNGCARYSAESRIMKKYTGKKGYYA